MSDKAKFRVRIMMRLGYLLAVPPLFLIIPSFKKDGKWPGLLPSLAEVIGATLITGGWILRRRGLLSFVNGTWLVVFSSLWLRQTLAKKA